MGAGAGAAATIENEPSPRRAAIEKIQAELRREVAVREERRRELEFLEKGGELLDFFSAPSSSIPPFSPAGPLAEQQVSSDVESSYIAAALANGDSLDDRLGTTCVVGSGVDDRHVGDDGAGVAAESLVSPWDGKVRAPRTGSASLRSHVDVNSKRESEGAGGGGRVGGKGQAYTRRNRQRSNRFGNGYTQSKEVDKAVESSSTSPHDLKTHSAAPPLPPVEATKENESMVEKTVQPLLIHLPLPNALGSRANVGSARANNHDAGFPIVNIPEQLPTKHAPTDHLADAINANSRNDSAPAECSPASPVGERDVYTEANVNKDVQVDDNSKKLDQLSAVVPGVDENVGLSGGSAVSQPLQQVSCNSQGAALDRDGVLPIEVKDENIVAMVREKSSIPGYGGPQVPKSDCKNKSFVLVTDSLPPTQRVVDRGTAISANHTFDPILATIVDDKRFVQVDGPHAPQAMSASRASSENRSNTTRKTTSTASSGALEHTKNDKVMIDGKPVEVTRVEVKIEEGISDAGTRLSTADTEAESGHDVQSVSIVSGPPEEATEGQSTPISGGSHRGSFRTPTFAGSQKFPGVVLPWEKEKDPNVLAAAEKHKAELSAKAKRAHEDYVIEEAEIIKTRRKDNAELAVRRAPLEPSRRRSHWDFVLAEMTWMANDFMQERLWKRAAAAQFSRWIAEIKGHSDFVPETLSQTQKRVSLIVSSHIMEFWKSVELTMVQDESRALPTTAKNQEQWSNRVIVKEEGGAVPMDVDTPLVAEVKKQLLIKEKSPVQEYAKRFIKASVGSVSFCQAEAPSTPERISECSAMSDPVWEKFPAGPLSYIVPVGAFAAYRSSVEAEWALKEAKYEQEHAVAVAEAEAQAAAEAVAAADVMVSSVDDGQPVLCVSSPQIGMRAEEEGSQYGLPNSSIAKKKRKNFLKSSPKVDGALPSLLSRPSPNFQGLDRGGGSLPSPLVTGKRSLPAAGGISGNASVGSIPTKRMRSGTARQRSFGGTASPSSFPNTTAGLLNRAGFSSAALSSNHEELNSAAEASFPARTDDDDSAIGKSMAGTGNANSFGGSKSSKKKKKTKHFSGNLGSSFEADGIASSPAGSTLKLLEAEPHSVYEQLKRKGDQLHGVSHDALGAGAGSSAETPETPASHGQPPPKKIRMAKSASDISPETAAAAAAVPATQAGSMISNTSSANKLIRQNSNRDRNRKGRSNKVSVGQPAGIGIPWSPIEDQAILALVHDLGPNWELVSDVLSSSSQLKGIFRRPKQCKERHKAVMDRLAVGEGGDSPEDPSSSQAPHPGIPKGSARHLLQRLQGPIEEDTLKIHLEQIVRVVTKFRAQKPQNEEPKTLLAPHASHVNIISQFCNSGAAGGFPNPLELCDPNPPNPELGGPSFALPGSHLAGVLPSGSGMRPASAGMPIMPNASNIQMGVPAMAPSNVAVNAARDVHRLVQRPFSPEERVRYARAMAAAAAARGLPVPGAPVTGGLPMMALPNPNDGAVPMLVPGNGVGMMGGLSRGMSLSRAGLPGMGSPGVTGMGSPPLGNMLSPGGVGMVGAGSSVAGPAGVPNPVLMRRQRDQMVRLQPGRTNEEQRQMLIELQHQAAQGNADAQTTLNTLNREMSAPMIAAQAAQNFAPQHPTQQQQQQYLVAARVAKERQQLQHQKQQRLMQQHQLQQQQPTTLPLQMQQQQQLHNMAHVLPQQAHMPQHQHGLSQQHALQKQVQQQQGSQPPGLSHPSSPVQPMGTSSIPLSHQQHQPIPQSLPQSQQPSPSSHGQQVSGQAKGQQSKQSQKHQHSLQSSQVHQQQQQAPRSSKGVVRGNMLMQAAGQPNMLQGPVAIGNQLPGQALPHSIPSQRSLQPQVSVSMVGKQLPQGSSQNLTGQQTQMQPQQGQSGTGPVSHGVVGQQQQKSLQQAQQMVLVPKQQHPSSHSQQPSPTAGLSPQQQLSPTSQQAQLSPSHQSQSQPQPQSRRQSQQQQPQLQPTGQRRLQQRQAGPPVGIPAAGQASKNGSSQQVGHISAQLPSQSGHVGYQLGTNLANSMSMVPVAAPLGNASPSGLHPTQWKSGQNVSSVPSGIYNLTRGGTSGPASIVPVGNSAGMHVTLLNGTSGMSNPVMHGLTVGGLPQIHQPMQAGSGVHGQKGGNGIGNASGTNSRSVTTSQGGAQRSVPQNNPASSHGNAVNSSGQSKPTGNNGPSSGPSSSSSGTSAAASPASGAPGGASQSGSAVLQGKSSSAVAVTVPVTSSGSMYGVQPRQSTLATATSGAPKAVASTATNITGNDVSTTSTTLVTPLAAGTNSTVADQTPS